MNQAITYKTPPKFNAIKEYRAGIDLLTLPVRLLLLNISKVDNIGRGRHVFVLPGFGASNKTMSPLRYVLKKHGFNTYGWGLGSNKAGLDKRYDPAALSWDFELPSPYRGEAGVAYLCDAMVDEVKQFHHKTGEKVILIGWSLGGSIAREVARDLPDVVEHVITLGSPLIGGPKYTAAASFIASKGLNLDWIEAEVNKRNTRPLQCKATSIISPSDGVVGYSATMVPEDKNTTYITLDVAHLGMGINRRILSTIIETLRTE